MCSHGNYIALVFYRKLPSIMPSLLHNHHVALHNYFLYNAII